MAQQSQRVTRAFPSHRRDRGVAAARHLQPRRDDRPSPCRTRDSEPASLTLAPRHREAAAPSSATTRSSARCLLNEAAGTRSRPAAHRGPSRAPRSLATGWKPTGGEAAQGTAHGTCRSEGGGARGGESSCRAPAAGRRQRTARGRADARSRLRAARSGPALTSARERHVLNRCRRGHRE